MIPASILGFISFIVVFQHASTADLATAEACVTALNSAAVTKKIGGKQPEAPLVVNFVGYATALGSGAGAPAPGGPPAAGVPPADSPNKLKDFVKVTALFKGKAQGCKIFRGFVEYFLFPINQGGKEVRVAVRSHINIFLRDGDNCPTENIQAQLDDHVKGKCNIPETNGVFSQGGSQAPPPPPQAGGPKLPAGGPPPSDNPEEKL